MKHFLFLLVTAGSLLAADVASIDGTAIANVASIDGTALANIASVDGVTIPAGGASYLLEENFEGAGRPATFTAVSTGVGTSVDFDYATAPAPLLGSQSFRVPHPTTSGTHSERVSPSAGADELWFAFALRVTANCVDNVSWIEIEDSSNNTIGTVDWRGGVDQDWRATATGGTQTADHSFGAVNAAAGTLYVKLRFKKGTGANAQMELWVSNNTTAWGTSVLSSNGTSPNAPRYVNFFNVNGFGTYTVIFDRWLIDDADIAIGAFL